MPYLLQGFSIGFILSHLKVPFDENTRKIAQAAISSLEKMLYTLGVSSIKEAFTGENHSAL